MQDWPKGLVNELDKIRARPDPTAEGQLLPNMGAGRWVMQTQGTGCVKAYYWSSPALLAIWGSCRRGDCERIQACYRKLKLPYTALLAMGSLWNNMGVGDGRQAATAMQLLCRGDGNIYTVSPHGYLDASTQELLLEAAGADALLQADFCGAGGCEEKGRRKRRAAPTTAMGYE
eukprot:1137565-Pyramimonas_sp.AAC.1